MTKYAQSGSKRFGEVKDLADNDKSTRRYRFNRRLVASRKRHQKRFGEGTRKNRKHQ